MLAALFPVLAETHIVSSSADDGEGTLRALCASAADGDTIAIPEGMTVTLASEITITSKSLEFVGEGSGAAVSGDDVARLFKYSIVWNNSERHFLRFKKLTLEKGRAENGAVVYALTNDRDDGVTLVFNDCQFLDNTATSANNNFGACFQNAGSGLSLFATNCVFSGNVGGRSVFGTAGNYTRFGGDVVFSRCQFKGNGSERELPEGCHRGGLFYGPALNFILDSCTMSGVTNVLAEGGTTAIYNNEWNTTVLHNFTMRDCVVEDNTVSGAGGASCGMFYISGYATNIIERCVFRRNKADPACGVLGYFGITAVFFNDCVFEENETTETNTQYDRGGLAFVRSGTNTTLNAGADFHLTRCAIRNNNVGSDTLFKKYTGRANSAEMGGGFGFDDCLFENNVTATGGSLSCTGLNDPMVVTRCSFVSNTPRTYPTGDGSGIMFPVVEGSTFRNCTFFGNLSQPFAPENGEKATYRFMFGNTVNLESCTIVSNTAAWTILQDPAASQRLVNCVVVDNLPKSMRCANGADLSGISHSFFGAIDGTAGVSALDENGNARNKTAAELGLVFPPAENNAKIKFLDGTRPLTLAIRKTSPLRDAGLVSAAPATDGRGISRALGGSAPDIGAYECVPTAFVVVVR